MSELRGSVDVDDDEVIFVGSDVATVVAASNTTPAANTTTNTAEHSQSSIGTFANTAAFEYNSSSTSNRQTLVPEETISISSSSDNNISISSTDACDNLPSCSRKSNVNTPSSNSGTNEEVNDSASGSSSVRMEDGENNPTSSSATGQVLECPICLLTCVHPTRLPCGHIFCYLCVKGVANKNHRCAMCRRNIPPEFLEHPQLVNGTDDICSTKATDDGYQWFYEGRNGWWQYDDRTSQDIEEAYKKGEKSCTILVAGYVYIVDLEAMLQQRQNEPSRCRRVKRDLATIPKKGVAGLRIEGGNIVTAEISSSHYSQNALSHQNQQILLPLDYNGADQRNLLQADYEPGDSINPEMRHVSTIAATDAAIRIASDIIGSTLAHADELTRRRSSMPTLAANSNAGIENYLSGEQNSLLTSNSISHSIPVSSSTTMLPSSSSSVQSSSNNPTTPPPLFRPLFTGNDQRRTIDLIEQTLNDFHALTLRNIIDSSDEEFNNDEASNVGNVDEEDDDFNIYNIARNILATSTVTDDSSEDTNNLPTGNRATTSSASNTNTTELNNDRDRDQVGD